MAELVRARNIAEAWVLTGRHLLQAGGSQANLIVEIQSDDDVPSVRDALDEFVGGLKQGRLASVSRVADTIFPIDYYRGQPGPKTRNHVYDMQRLSAKVEHRFVGDCYFDRMIDWPYVLVGNENGKTFNQLEFRIQRLIKAWNSGKRTMNDAELALSAGAFDDYAELELSTGDVRVQHPSKDTTPIGFPCLSHVSLTLHKGRLDLTATYRNQHFVSKAYGNYLGLCRLLRFIVAEVGCEMGSVVCIATHADGEFSKNGIAAKAIERLLVDCGTLLAAWDATDRPN